MPLGRTASPGNVSGRRTFSTSGPPRAAAGATPMTAPRLSGEIPGRRSARGGSP
jgi:hypothetical protein